MWDFFGFSCKYCNALLRTLMPFFISLLYSFLMDFPYVHTKDHSFFSLYHWSSKLLIKHTTTFSLHDFSFSCCWYLPLAFFTDKIKSLFFSNIWGDIIHLQSYSPWWNDVQIWFLLSYCFFKIKLFTLNPCSTDELPWLMVKTNSPISKHGLWK